MVDDTTATATAHRRTGAENSSPTMPAQTARLMRQATYASITVALVLILAKLVAWGVSDSLSLLATLIDSTLDALASLINLLAGTLAPHGVPRGSRASWRRPLCES